ncbi:glucoamylase family protein [Membranihabitans marinus]|uniref:glucoamylase family protein n=1 Tax=Membranihabitans marinus TaxID=1227546 RepID=UPI001F2E9C50|nr:glucoamylase family protein [Membranihabitans marinus]
MKRILVVIVCIAFLGTSCSTRNKVEHDRDFIDEALLTQVQQQTFNYMWEGGEPISGGARERIHMDDIYPSNDEDVITSGGTGFGIMAILVGIERGFITREEGYERLLKLTDWLATADRFYGVWPHWFTPDGKVRPFSQFDDGGDLVETAFLAQGLITARQYFMEGNPGEKALAQKMDELWRGIDWQWYTKGGEDVLYWHWSPNHGWKMDFDVRGYNECLIMYVLAASSPTHPVSAEVYHKGFMLDGDIVTQDSMYGIPTLLNHYETNNMHVGPLFWAHYSYLGLDPRNLKDQYTDWWAMNQNHAKIHYQHCLQNPYDYRGYSEECWGLSSSYSIMGYAGHNPQEDLGVITPTAALSSFPYTPEESMRFLNYMYTKQDSLIGKYGPYDAFSIESNWSLPRYLAIDQLPIPVMIENYRSGLLWNLFMSAPEIQSGLNKLGFTTQ